LDTTQNCSTEVSITAVKSTSYEVQAVTINMVGGKWVMWCPGAKHTWIGTLKANGYTFASDAANPLQFAVDPQGGYDYVGGKGTVTQPDGIQVPFVP
jgi:hypothetical protein